MTMNLPVVADSLTLYLAEIRKFPLLDAEEEKRLAVAYFEEKELSAAHTAEANSLARVYSTAVRSGLLPADDRMASAVVVSSRISSRERRAADPRSKPGKTHRSSGRTIDAVKS